MLSATMASTWAEWRYGKLLRHAATGRPAGRVYAGIVSQVELIRDVERRRVATARIARARRISSRAALGVYRRSLFSEAIEEADSARLMRDREALARWLAPDAPPRIDGPVLYASLHLGTPVFGLLYLQNRLSHGVCAMVRNLDDGNPMVDAKRRWGERKMAWLRETTGGAIVGADSTAVTIAREHLLAGNAVFAAIDVPGDVVSRSTTVDLFGERVAFSSGIVRLATLTESTIVPMIALGGERMKVYFGSRVRSADPDDAMLRTFGELKRFIDQFPGEWWMWPYVRPADDP